jgi:hypothetical protein
LESQAASRRIWQELEDHQFRASKNMNQNLTKGSDFRVIATAHAANGPQTPLSGHCEDFVLAGKTW